MNKKHSRKIGGWTLIILGLGVLSLGYIRPENYILTLLIGALLITAGGFLLDLPTSFTQL